MRSDKPVGRPSFGYEPPGRGSVIGCPASTGFVLGGELHSVEACATMTHLSDQRDLLEFRLAAIRWRPSRLGKRAKHGEYGRAPT